MNVKSVETEKGSAKIVVEIEKPEFENALNKAYTKCRKNIMIPGFRKGKAPRKMVEAMYGATVFYEDAVNERQSLSRRSRRSALRPSRTWTPTRTAT